MSIVTQKSDRATIPLCLVTVFPNITTLKTAFLIFPSIDRRKFRKLFLGLPLLTYPVGSISRLGSWCWYLVCADPANPGPSVFFCSLVLLFARLRAVSRFSSVSHACERASSSEAAERVKRGLSHLAPSVTRVCILPVLFDGLRKKRDCS